ncbi:MarR family transcriptional regulator [Aquimarina sp. MAR_2010_214]|uniref:MarR family winged helix-turn-helix transcriptional regulator n=1 Tax=Aquimarina sp. MAR_2010_214 TaxID=1250026 RepID=UPI000C706B10|nr:MarR family transcriptional regulator [Aquimarina sp. MAR_2010_214]PKV49383.1 MarR family transcriptional regulator [Aquimarina sp. MAR_2010_214]
MQDKLQEYAELGLGSRLKRLSEFVMKEIQVVYTSCHIDFDPYLFPIFKIIIDQGHTTTTDIQEKLHYTQPAITQALKKLMDKELVEYKIDTSDKRKKLFQLTKKGNETHQIMIPLWKIIDEQVKWLTEGTATSLIRHLTHLEDQLRKKSLSERILEKYQISSL